MRLITGNSAGTGLIQAITPPGGKAIFGKAKSGKTLLSEIIVSTLVRTEREFPRPYAPYTTEVVSAALNSWFAGNFFSVVRESGVISPDSLRSWVDNFIDVLQLDSVPLLAQTCSLTSPDAWDEFIRRSRIAHVASRELSKDKSEHLSIASVPVLNGVHNDIESDFHPICDWLGRFIGAYLVIDAGADSLDKALVTSGKPDGAKPLESDKLVDRAYFDKVQVSRKANDETWFCGELKLNRFTFFHEKFPQALMAKYEDSNLCLTNNGLQFRKPDADLGHSGHEEIEFSEKWVKVLHANRNSIDPGEEWVESVEEMGDDNTLSKIEAMVASMVERDPYLLLGLLINSGVLSAMCGSSPSISTFIGESLRELYLKIGGMDDAVLVMTEKKAWDSYSAVAHNISIETKSVRMTVRLEGGEVLSYDAATSLLNAAVGGLLLNPVVHVSTLDLTMVHDLSVKSATQSGGLDSSILNLTQFGSNAASDCEGHMVLETRDDFGPKTQNEDQARSQARATLGANSALAIHIEAIGQTTRDIWMRFKGADEFNDEEIQMAGIDLKADYMPINVIRDETVAKQSIFDQAVIGLGRDNNN